MSAEPDPESATRAMRESVRSCSCLLFGSVFLFAAAVLIVHWLTSLH